MLPASKKSTLPKRVDENLGHEDDLEEFDHSEQELEEETEEVTDSNDVSSNESNLDYSSRLNLGECSAQYCSDEGNAFHPNGKPTLQSLRSRNRNFRSQRYNQFPWITVCVSSKIFFVTIVDMLKSISGLHLGVEKRLSQRQDLKIGKKR